MGLFSLTSFPGAEEEPSPSSAPLNLLASFSLEPRLFILDVGLQEKNWPSYMYVMWCHHLRCKTKFKVKGLPDVWIHYLLIVYQYSSRLDTPVVTCSPAETCSVNTLVFGRLELVLVCKL